MASLALMIGLTCGSSVLASSNADDETLTFLAMGDWGGAPSPPWTTPAEVQTAAGMQKVASTMTPTPMFALALGDNFYTTGIQGDAHAVRFNDTFENVFTGSNLQSPFEFRILAGNHDHYGNVTAQIARSEISKRWVFPDLWYTFTKGGNGLPTVQFIMIDTVVLSGNSDVRDEQGNLVSELPGSKLPGASNKDLADQQLVWLNQTLEASTADYIIVGGHYPIWSICEHGPTESLIEQVKPALEHYKATMWVNGHDHCMEYFNDGGYVDYHTIGSAHSNDPSTAHADAVPKGSLKFHTMGTNGGFASFSASKTGITVTHHQGDGSVAYVAPAHPPRNNPMAQQ